MVSSRLTAQPTSPGWLALLLAVMVISLCFSQRMGLKVVCAYQPAPHNIHYPAADTGAKPLSQRPLQVVNKTESNHPNGEPDQDSCGLSGQLLNKAFQHLDPLFIAIILLFALWIAPRTASRYRRRKLSPLLFSGRRRHLVLCVFRE